MSITKRTRFEVLRACNYTCAYCGRKAPDVVLHVDHIIPQSRGGSDDLQNLTAACADCNHGKSNSTDKEAATRGSSRDLSSHEYWLRICNNCQCMREHWGNQVRWWVEDMFGKPYARRGGRPCTLDDIYLDFVMASDSDLYYCVGHGAKYESSWNYSDEWMYSSQAYDAALAWSWKRMQEVASEMLSKGQLSTGGPS